VWMALAGHQLLRALALALGVPAAHEAAVVQEEPQHVQIRATEVTAQGALRANDNETSSPREFSLEGTEG